MPPRRKPRQEKPKPPGGGGAPKPTPGPATGSTGKLPRPRRKRGESDRSYEARLEAWRARKGEAADIKSPFYPNTLRGEGFQGRLPGQGQPGMPVPGAYTDRVAPLYQEGMQWDPVNLTPDEIWEIQQALMDSGYASNLTAKVWDEKSANAFKNVLTAANHQGIPWQDVIAQGMESEEAYAAAAAESERGPLQIELTNPSDLGADLTGVAGGDDQPFGAIGRGATDAEKMRFAESYQNQERLTQTDAYNRGLDAGEFTGPSSTQVAADEWLKQNNPEEYIATRAAKQAAVWYDLLENSQWRLSSG